MPVIQRTVGLGSTTVAHDAVVPLLPDLGEVARRPCSLGDVRD